MVVFSCPEDQGYHGRVIYMFAGPLGKGYIGKASDAHRRIHGHRGEAYAKKDGDWKCNSIWKQAIRRIGWDNLRVVILEFVGEDESLEDKERYWIAKMKTQDPSGYNSNKGGGGPTKHTEEAKAKMSAKAEKKPVTSREIKEEYADGTQLVEFVSYASSHEAARKTGVDFSHISACCNEKVNSAGNRFWHFTEDGDLVGEHRVDNIGDAPGPSTRKRAVFSTSPGGKKQRHESGKAAKRTLSESTGKTFYAGNISACCSGDRKSHHGYTFCFESDEAEIKNTKKRKRN